MSSTIRVSSAVSKRKIVNSRCTRRPTSADWGPNSCAALVDPPELRADEADPDRRRDRPAGECEVDPERAPAEAALLHERDAEPERGEQRRRIDPRADPRAHLAERGHRLAVRRRSKTMPSVVSVMSPPTQMTIEVTCSARESRRSPARTRGGRSRRRAARPGKHRGGRGAARPAAPIPSELLKRDVLLVRGEPGVEVCSAGLASARRRGRARRAELVSKSALNWNMFPRSSAPGKPKPR